MDLVSGLIDGCFLVRLNSNADSRGSFQRFFCAQEFLDAGLVSKWAQANLVKTLETGTLRGLHLQKDPHQEVKFIQCLSGEIFDVVVDCRPGSFTLGRVDCFELASRNNVGLYVPEGCAHGYVTLADDTEIVYLVSAPYAPGAEVVIAWDDCDLAIDWPIAPLKISDKDAAGSSYSDALEFLSTSGNLGE